MTRDQLINDLLIKGGAIVGSQDCSALEFANADLTNRFCVLDDGCGLVRRVKGWLDLQKKREILYPNKKSKYSTGGIIK